MKKPTMQGKQYPSGYDGRYRVWTINDAPFHRFPAYADGGPAMVVIDGWCKSTETLCRHMSSPEVVAADDGKVKLNLRRDGRKHQLNGTRYDTQREADRAAYEAGCTGYMVYVKDEAKYGL